MVDIARAWKDPEYRKTLTPEELASVPKNPAGDRELTLDDLKTLAGGYYDSIGTCKDTCVCTIVCPKKKFL